MNNCNRIFGSGSKGLLISLLLLFAASYIKKIFSTSSILINQGLIPILIFILLTIFSIIIVLWSILSLNPKLRGKTLITTGVLKYFRHPLYVVFFNKQQDIYNWCITASSNMAYPYYKRVKKIFPNEYQEYCKNTRRFFPKFIKNKR